MIQKNYNALPPSHNEAPPTNTVPAAMPVQYTPAARSPIITYILLGITLFIFLLQTISRLFLQVDLPAGIGLKVNNLIVNGQYWRLVTPMFLHGDVLHIMFNMYALYVFGRRLERFYGHGRFLSLYLLAGICGNIFSFYFQSSPSLGASTAVFGLVAAEGVFIYVNRKFFPNANRALREIITIVLINIVLGLSPQIDNWGHFGGLIGGLVFAWFCGPLFEIHPVDYGLVLRDRHLDQRVWLIAMIELMILALLAAFRITVLAA